MMANGRLALNLDLKTRKKWNPEGLFGVVAGTKTPFKSVMERLVNVVRDRIGRENQMLAANLRKSFSTHVVERFGDFIREFHQLLVVGFI